MNIGVVLVTFNRKLDLKKALEKYENQIKKPEYIVVVNNNSSDGTEQMLAEWKLIDSSINKYVLNLDENIGGSGGFYTGLKKAKELDAEWIWIADDDAYPNEDALSNIEKFYENAKLNKKDIAAFCGVVINNNKIDTDHRRRISSSLFKINESEVSLEEYEKDYFEVDLFSYVGSVINKEYLEKVGLTEKDYFIYYDDTEHSLRLSKSGKVFCLTNVKITHDTALQGREEINWKLYYWLRNKLNVYKKHFPKRYFYCEYFKKYIKFRVKSIFNKDDDYYHMMIAALKDSKSNKQGLHEKYRPGWKYNNPN